MYRVCVSRAVLIAHDVSFFSLHALSAAVNNTADRHKDRVHAVHAFIRLYTL